MDIIETETTIEDVIAQDLVSLSSSTLKTLSDNWIKTVHEVLYIIRSGDSTLLGPSIKSELTSQFQKFLFPSPDNTKLPSLITLYSSNINPNTIHSPPFLKPGIIHSLGTKFNTREFTNPVESRVLRLSCNRSVDSPIRNIILPNDNTILIVDSSDTRIKFNFNGYRAKITGIACLISKNIGVLPINLEIFGSNNDISWVKLFTTSKVTVNTSPYTVTVKTSILTPNTVLFTRKDLLCPPSFFTYFMITMPKSYNNSIVGLSQFEVYGTIAKDPITNYTTEKIVDCGHIQDLDSNGLISLLGQTNNGFKNPVLLGKVGVESSDLYINSTPALSLLNRELVTFSTDYTSDAYVSFDFSPVFIRVNKYTLVHYTSYDKEAIRYWEFQAYDKDANLWKVLKSHNNDKSLTKRGASKTWNITTSVFASKFRILMTGPNSNKNWYLCLGMVEFYGTVKIPEDWKLPFGNVKELMSSFKRDRGFYLEFINVEEKKLDEDKGVLYLVGTEGLQVSYKDYRVNDNIEYLDNFGKFEIAVVKQVDKVVTNDNKKEVKNMEVEKDELVRKSSVEILDDLFGDLVIDPITDDKNKNSGKGKGKSISKDNKKENKEGGITDDKIREADKYNHFYVEESGVGCGNEEESFIKIMFKSILVKPSGFSISYFKHKQLNPIKRLAIFGILGTFSEELFSEENENYFLTKPVLKVNLDSKSVNFYNGIMVRFGDQKFLKSELRIISELFEIYGVIIDYKGLYSLNNPNSLSTKYSSLTLTEQTSDPTSNSVTNSNHRSSLNTSSIRDFVITNSPQFIHTDILNFTSEQYQNKQILTVLNSETDDFSGFPFEGFLNSLETLLTLKPSFEAFIGLDIKTYYFSISSYSLLLGELAFMFGTPKNFSLEISLDSEKWHTIDHKALTQSLIEGSPNKFEALPNTIFVDKFRLKSTGANSIGKPGFSLNCLSPFGKILKAHPFLKWKSESKILLEKEQTKANVKLSKFGKDKIKSQNFKLKEIWGKEFGVLISKKEIIEDEEFDIINVSLEKIDGSKILVLEKVLVKVGIKVRKFECFGERNNTVWVNVGEEEISVDNNEQILTVGNDLKNEGETECVIVFSFKGTKAVAGLVVK